MQCLKETNDLFFMKFSEFYKFIEAHGWVLDVRKGTNHHRYVHPDHDFSVPVGRHPTQDIGPKLLDRMLKELGLKEEFKKRKKK